MQIAPPHTTVCAAGTLYNHLSLQRQKVKPVKCIQLGVEEQLYLPQITLKPRTYSTGMMSSTGLHMLNSGA